MAPLIDSGRRVGCYIVGETAGADGPFGSRDNVTLEEGAVYEPGMVLGRLTATGKYVPLAATAADPATGSEVVSAICYGLYDASDADVEGVASVRHTRVNGHELIWPEGYDAGDIEDGIAALEGKGITVRY